MSKKLLTHGTITFQSQFWANLDLSKLYLVDRKILKNRESCVIDGGITTKYYKLNKGAHQGDPISAYLFILALEILFLLINENPHINKLNIFYHCYLYSAYANDTTKTLIP